MLDEEEKDRLAEITAALIRISDSLKDSNKIHEESMKALYEISNRLSNGLNVYTKEAI